MILRKMPICHDSYCSRLLLAALFGVLLFGAVGCGKKGAPAPPRPRGPLPPLAVAARQIGSELSVSFTVPEPRGSAESQQPLMASLYRVLYSPGIKAPVDPVVFLRRGKIVNTIDIATREPGQRVQLIDIETAELEQGGQGHSRRYGIRLQDRKGRQSLPVMAEDLVPLESASGPSGVSAQLAADGVHLKWDPLSSTADVTYNIYRSVPDGPLSATPINPVPLEETTYLDRGAPFGGPQSYRVRVVLEPGNPRREGESSTPVSLAVVDTFPPARPEGLIAVQEGTAVRLFWNPNAEKDLAGYRVYRHAEDEDWLRIGAELQERPTMLDDDVQVGRRLYYRVIAIDQASPPNPSVASETVPITILAEPEQ
jgi:hypothetical protein